MAINDTTPCTTAATVASSTGQRLAAIAERVYSAGPQAVLRALCATLTTSNPLEGIERVAQSTLPVPARLTCTPDTRKPQPPALRLVK